MLYFAYGSNMCSGRLVRRVPSAVPLFVAALRGYRLRFHKRSNDGSGKANAFRTDNENDVIWGVVFRLVEGEKPQLDEAEGLSLGYVEEWIDVADELGNAHSALVYLAAASHINDSLQPYTWYKRFVVEGARQHSLPEPYVAALEREGAIEDQNRKRTRA